MFVPQDLLLPLVVGVEFRGLMARSDDVCGLRLWLVGYTADRTDYYFIASVSSPAAVPLATDSFVPNRQHAEAAMVIDGLLELGAFVKGEGEALVLNRTTVQMLAEEFGALGGSEDGASDSAAGDEFAATVIES